MTTKTIYEKISSDEAQTLRKDCTGSNGSLVKGVAPEVVKASSWDKNKRSARFVMSAEVSDRMGDIVVQEGLSLDNFKANPQALLFHNSRSWPIGKWDSVEKLLNGRPKRTEGDMILLPEGDDADADRAARHIAAGTMRTVSIGFRVNWDAVEAIRDENKNFLGLRYLDSELLECSLVPIPALPAAVMREADPSMLSKEHIELVEMTLDNWARDPRTRAVVRRDTLEAQYRDAAGETPTFIMFRGQLSDELLADLRKQMGAGQILDLQPATPAPAVEKSNGGEAPAPKDGEEAPVAPNPADTEKQKEDELDANAALAIEEDLDRHFSLAREFALESKEPSLWARFIKALGVVKNTEEEPVAADPAKSSDPVAEKTEVKSMSEEEIEALRVRATEVLSRTEKLLT